MKTLLESLKETHSEIVSGITELTERIDFLKLQTPDKRGILKDSIASCEKNLESLKIRKGEYETAMSGFLTDSKP